MISYFKVFKNINCQFNLTVTLNIFQNRVSLMEDQIIKEAIPKQKKIRMHIIDKDGATFPRFLDFGSSIFKIFVFLNLVSVNVYLRKVEAFE